MRELKNFNLKAFFFHYFRSWRMVLICLVVFVAAVLAVSWVKASYAGTISEREHQQQIDAFIEKEPEGQFLKNNIEEVEANIFNLRRQLKENLFLQIDPEHRVNKSFVLDFDFSDGRDPNSAEVRRDRNALSLRYLQAVSDDQFFQSLTEKGLISPDESSARALIRSEINQDGKLFMEVTAPQESMIDEILSKIKSYLEKNIHARFDPLNDYRLLFEREQTEIVQDPGIARMKSEIEVMIAQGEKRVEELKDDIVRASDRKNNYVPGGQGNADGTANAAPASRFSLKKAALGVFCGLLAGIVITLIRFWHQIGTIDLPELARQFNMLYLGAIPVRDDARKKTKFPGKALDRWILRRFGREYREDAASETMDYSAQMILGKVSAFETSLSGNEALRMGSEGGIRPHHPLTLIIPGTETSISKTRLIEKLQSAVDAASPGAPVRLRVTGNFAGDPGAIRAVRQGGGLLFLWNSHDAESKLNVEYQISQQFAVPVFGILEICDAC